MRSFSSPQQVGGVKEVGRHHETVSLPETWSFDRDLDTEPAKGHVILAGEVVDHPEARCNLIAWRDFGTKPCSLLLNDLMTWTILG